MAPVTRLQTNNKNGQQDEVVDSSNTNENDCNVNVSPTGGEDANFTDTSSSNDRDDVGIEKELWSQLSVEQKLQWLKEKQERQEREKQRLHELKLEELRLKGRRDTTSSFADQIEKYSKIIKATAIRAPHEDVEIPTWLNHIEKALKYNSVPENLWGRILVPLLPERARFALNRLNDQEQDNYEALKEAVLKQCNMDPHNYWQKFNNTYKQEKETWLQFAERLYDLLDYYWKSRSVDTFQKAKDICVADQFKRKLPEACREHVVLNEGVAFKTALDLARLAQKFDEAKVNRGKPRLGTAGIKAGEAGNSKFSRKVDTAGKPKDPENGVSNENHPVDVSSRENRAKGYDSRPKCYACGKRGHTKRECRSTVSSSAHPEKQVNRVVVAAGGPSENGAVASENAESDNIRVARVSENVEKLRKTHQLETVDILVEGVKVKAVVDSGAETSVINPRIIRCKAKVKPESTTVLVGPFGNRVRADVVTVGMSLGEEAVETKIMCAATEKLSGDFGCLINPEDLKVLEKTRDELRENRVPKELIKSAVFDGGNEEIRIAEDKVRKERHNKIGQVVNERVDTDGESSSGEGIVNSDLFAAQQKEDKELEPLWEKAKNQAQGMFVKNGFLYRKDSLNGMVIGQLVVPKVRRQSVLEQAHDSVWAGHLGSRKTTQRIRTSFFWPGMARDAKKFVQSCHHCQMRARPKTADRVPITPLLRPETAFSIVNIDIAGPIEPTSSRGHKWVLSLVDLTTRWPEIVPLRSLNAKTTCDALLSIFARTGLPRQISSDQGSGFISRLTKQLMDTLKVELRFSTPSHPNSNGAVERWNATMKQMLAHAVREQGRNWDKALPYIAWAYREVPNETTGVSPFQLMYGRIPHGPLNLLAEEWSAQEEVPLVFANDYRSYANEVKNKIAEAMEVADRVAAGQQKRYTEHYNLRSRSRKFEVGESVLVLKRNPANKLDEKWEGPGVIERKLREDSYLVRMPNGKARNVHADNMKQYYARISAIGITFEDDKEFGDIEWAPTRSDELEKGELVDVSHLTDQQGEEIKGIIDEFGEIFSSKPGKTHLIEHKIELQAGYSPKKVLPYRIPLSLRSEVDRQISELLETGLIEPSESEVAYPIVCVAKRDGGVRMTVDYRKLNGGTLADSFPMKNASELVLEIAKSKYISVLDMSRGYWQVPMAKDSQKLTAFVTDKGTYQWCVMPFGLRNSAATFQRLMNKVLARHVGYAVAYIDDVAIYSENWEEHIQHLRAVLRSLKESGLRVNPSKCKLGCNETEYLGKIVGSGRHSVDEGRVDAVRQKQRPKTKRELRQFLGFASYYREYIPHFATVALPLTELTGRKVKDPLPWNAEADDAFNTLKNHICNLPKLFAPVMDKPFYVYCDASEKAVGACLAQLDETGKECPIAFASQKLNQTQSKWAAIEREAYAVIFALKRFDTWIYGNEIIIVSDHNPLQYLTASAPRGGKLTRWALALQRYGNLRIIYRKGADHINADWLSRNVAENEGAGEC